jgi:pimeloyl-ACP methyl ester carboxylesterase
MTYLPYVEHGDPDGVPVVMLHGVTDSWRSFEHVLPHLPDEIRAISVTQRGHGDAPKPDGGYTIPQLAEDVVELMDDLGIERGLVVGHSMGGWVAQRLAIDHPDRLIGVVLAASFARSVRDVPELAAFCEEMAMVQDPLQDELAREFQESTVATPLAPAELDTFVSESLKLPARVWRALFGGFLDIDHREELGEIRAPVLMVWGDQDAFIPREDQAVLEEALEDARLLVYEGIGHAVHWEQPERFATDVAEFSRYCAALSLSR